MDILTNFGVKPILLMAQVVNFLILLFILKRFLYKPLLKALDQRKQRIADSLRNAEEIEKRLEQTTKEREERLKKASREAEEILAEAAKTADRIVAEAHLKAGHDIKKLMEKSKDAMEQERGKLHQEIRGELADLVAASLQKVTGKIITTKDQKEMIQRSVEGLA
ncbi:MAG: F0F1 ATP synthase subunit B [bacterium]|nr:F0F1 ATP synthase subunit B [bacterium]